MVFRTGFGLGLFYFLGAPWLIVVLLAIAHWNQSDWISILGRVLAIALTALMAYFMLSTNYRVERGILHVRMGPFKRSIAIDSTTSITGYGITRGRVYGLGSDIMGITYKGGAIDITPKDSDGFLAAIGFPSLTEQEDAGSLRSIHRAGDS